MSDPVLGALSPVPVSNDSWATAPYDAYQALASFTEAWLHNRRLSENTRDCYRLDIREYLSWCATHDLDPLAARFTHVNEFGRHIEVTPRQRTGAPPAPATVARKIAAVSSWYDFLAKMQAVPANPAKAADRPRVDRDHTATVGFTAAEAKAMLAATADDRFFGPHCAAALLAFMVDIGARVSEVCAVDVEHLGHDSGHRTVALLSMKGGKRRIRSMPPALATAVDAYLAERARRAGTAADEITGPLFVALDGLRVDRFQVYRFIRRVAKKAGLSSAALITPHSGRHAWATIARLAGADLETRQHALGHADPRTTQRYDRNRFQLDSDPSYLVAAAVASAEQV